jgi:replicative DNA helicase
MPLHPSHFETSKAVEEQLIAGIILRPGDFYAVAEALHPSDFVTQAMADAWQAFQAMAKEGIEFQRESVMISELRKRGVFDKLGGDIGFAELVTRTVPGHTVYHSEEVAKWAERRRVLLALEWAVNEASSLSFDADAVVTNAQQRLLKAKSIAGDDVQHLGDLMSDYLAALEDARANNRSAAVVQTGFREIDTTLSGGIPLGSYAILAARPSIGKSALAMDIAQNAAANGDASLFVSLEMSNQQIGQRQFVKNADVRIMEMQSASYSDEACLRMLKACSDAKQLPLYVWQAAGVSMGRIESRVRSVVAKHGVRLVVIDYLGLIRGQDAHQKTYERVTQISGELARLSKQLNVALLVLCQLGRAAEGEEPSINMLRDSGAIEQDADIVMLLHREARDSQDATVLIEKQRNGKVGKFGLRFDGKRFSDIFQQAAECHGDFE